TARPTLMVRSEFTSAWWCSCCRGSGAGCGWGSGEGWGWTGWTGGSGTGGAGWTGATGGGGATGGAGAGAGGTGSTPVTSKLPPAVGTADAPDGTAAAQASGCGPWPA